MADSPTPKRGSGKDQRKGLFARMALFLRQVVAELRKVICRPARNCLTYTRVVLVFVVTMGRADVCLTWVHPNCVRQFWRVRRARISRDADAPVMVAVVDPESW